MADEGTDLELVFDGEAFAQELGSGTGKIKTKYMLLFTGDMHPEDARTLYDLLAASTNWTKAQLRELDTDDLFTLFNKLMAAVEVDGVDPQKTSISSPGETVEGTAHPVG